MATLGLLPESAGYIAGLSVLAAVATLAVGLRFWAMSLTRAGLHPDEWLSLVTIVTCHGLTATVFLAFVRYGLGHSTVELTEANLAVTVSLRKVGIVNFTTLSELTTSPAAQFRCFASIRRCIICGKTRGNRILLSHLSDAHNKMGLLCPWRDLFRLVPSCGDSLICRLPPTRGELGPNCPWPLS